MNKKQKELIKQQFIADHQKPFMVKTALWEMTIEEIELQESYKRENYCISCRCTVDYPHDCDNCAFCGTDR